MSEHLDQARRKKKKKKLPSTDYDILDVGCVKLIKRVSFFIYLKG